jgi:hypothetical protein
MTTTPYAKTLMQIDGGALVSGPQTVAGGNVVQLAGESTVSWLNQTWQIYEYPLGFALPTGWVNNNGIYESYAVVPPPFTIPLPTTRWGKYLTNLVVNQGLLNGVYQGVGTSQPLVDISGVIQTKSPILGLSDIAYRETNQFDPLRQWVGELKATLRVLENAASGQGAGLYRKSLAANVSTTLASLQPTLLQFPIAANEVWYVVIDMQLLCNGVGGVKFGVDIPTGAVVEGGVSGYGASYAAITGARINADLVATTNAFCTQAGTTPARAWMRIKNGATAGTVIWNFQAATATQTAQIYAGSVMEASRTTEV